MDEEGEEEEGRARARGKSKSEREGESESVAEERGDDAESAWEAPGFVRDRTASNSAPAVSSLSPSLSRTSPLACRLPLAPTTSSRASRPPLESQNSATPALKLGSTVLTVHDSWDSPTIVRFDRPPLVDVKRDAGRNHLARANQDSPDSRPDTCPPRGP